MNLVPASSFGHAELARLFEGGYEGYFVPIHVDEATFAFMVDAWDIDLGRSLVAVEEGTPVGVTMLVMAITARAGPSSPVIVVKL